MSFALIFNKGAQGHSFPSPNDPEFQMEQAAADFASAQQNAATEGVSTGVIEAAETVYSSFLLWPEGPKGALITACFWNGSAVTQEAVIKSDNIWEGFSGLAISYTDSSGKIDICNSANDADIRISLVPSDPKIAGDFDSGRPASGFWSLVGRQSSFAPPGQQEGKRYKVTVNLPNIERYRMVGDWNDFNFLVRHELGHARGLLHEHQRQECMGWFNIPAIAKSQNWTVPYTEEAVASFAQLPDANYFKPTYVGSYDILSIMQYNFQQGWYLQKPGKINPCERTIPVSVPSPGDKATLVAMYPPLSANVVAFANPPFRNIGDMKKNLQVFVSEVKENRDVIATLKDSQSFPVASDKSTSATEDIVKQEFQFDNQESVTTIDAIGKLQRSVERLVALESGQ